MPKILQNQEKFTSWELLTTAQYQVLQTFAQPTVYDDEAVQPAVWELLTKSIVTPKSEIPGTWFDKDYREGIVEGWVENTIGWQIRVNREKRSLSQSKLAALASVHRSSISRLENMTARRININILIKIAHAFDCALDVRLVEFEEIAALQNKLSPKDLTALPFNEYEQKTLSRA